MDIYQHDSILAKKGGSGYMNTGFDQNLLKSKSIKLTRPFTISLMTICIDYNLRSLQLGDNKRRKE